MAVAVLGAAACSDGSDDGDAGGAETESVAATDADVAPLRPPAVPTEHVGLTTSIEIDQAGFDALASQLFGEDAAEGTYLDAEPLGAGLTLSSAAHPEAADQVAVTVAMETTGAEPVERTVASVPASVATGRTFIDAVDAAMAKTAEVEAEDPEGRRAWRIEHRSRSAQGGTVHVGVVYEPDAGTRLEVMAQGPTTSLLADRINQAATEGAPYETIYGLVWFDVSRDQFDFFSNRAYGISAGRSQNFTDFELVPHNWLRLTVTPELDQDRVSVGFEVVTLDGRRVPVAKAPASLVAGEQFMQTVFRMAENMDAQEAEAPGSSTPGRCPSTTTTPRAAAWWRSSPKVGRACRRSRTRSRARPTSCATCRSCPTSARSWCPTTGMRPPPPAPTSTPRRPPRAASSSPSTPPPPCAGPT
jgi:hypothetical protein